MTLASLGAALLRAALLSAAMMPTTIPAARFRGIGDHAKH
jgi:hypothetical protein